MSCRWKELVALRTLWLPSMSHLLMVGAKPVASSAWSVRIAFARLKVLSLETRVTSYDVHFRLTFAHLALCAAAIFARPSALIVPRLRVASLCGRPRFRGAT